MATLYKQLTPVLELYIRFSCPVVEEKVSFKFPGPTSMLSLCELSVSDTKCLRFAATVWKTNQSN